MKKLTPLSSPCWCFSSRLKISEWNVTNKTRTLNAHFPQNAVVGAAESKTPTTAGTRRAHLMRIFLRTLLLVPRSLKHQQRLEKLYLS
jgi:hypothetical protein